MTRRFFKEVTVSSDNGIMLDTRVLKTPLKAVLKLPMPALAEAIAAEWREQGEHIRPLSMPITRLANTAIDRVGAERDKIKAEILEFAGSDMVCYRAESPPALISRQAELWDPVIDWARSVTDAPFVVTTGVMHVEQPEAAIKAFAVHLHAMDDFTIAVLHNLTTLTGSALLAAMIEARAIDSRAAWAAAFADEDWQIEQWGEDEEASLLRARRLKEFEACCRFLATLR